jgi:lysophospholipid acyltransferase (LPLAT)-like uncharacterized protein
MGLSLLSWSKTGACKEQGKEGAVLVLWHAFLFLGLRFFSSFLLFCLMASTAFSCKQ